MTHHHHHPPPPKLEEWEGSKENILPLPEGRSAATLSRLHKSLHPHQPPREERLQFEEQLKLIHEVDDPLDLYHRYIQWLQQNYISGSIDFVSVLERATKEFSQDGR